MAESSCLKREWLHAWLEGELEDIVEARIASHVRACTACARVADEISREREARSPDQAAEQGTVNPGSPADVSAADLAGHDSDPLGEVTTVYSFDHDRASRAGFTEARYENRRFGRFELRQRVGVGGFGVVYRAFDTTLQRDVALKLPRNAAFADEQVKAAFLREARAAAALRHPNIVPIFDAGEIDEQCYLTAAFCPGETLAAWRRRNGGKASPRTAGAIVRQLAGALAHAHAAGILHQDVKPENVLLDTERPSDDLPFAPLLTDFGLARLMNAPETRVHSSVALGTARYMAPEQASRTRTPIGPAVDVYALGVILYELLTGRAPIQGEDEIDTLSRLAVDLPPPPEHFAADLPRDLGAICLKCLEKDPVRRYPSARELEADLQRFLSGQSTRARPHRAWERAWRTVRRHPTGAALVATLVLSLSGFVIGLAWHAAGLQEHGRELQRLNTRLAELLESSQAATALAERREAERAEMLYASDLRLAGRAWREGDARTLDERLSGQFPGPAGVDRRDFAWWFLSGFARPPLTAARVSELPLYAAVASPDARRVAVGGHDGMIRLLDAATLQVLQSIDTGQREVNGLAFASDGARLASAGQNGSICVWELPDGRLLRRIAAHPEQAFQCAFFDADRLLISCGENDPVIRIWDVATGTAVGSLEGHENGVEFLARSPAGNVLASVSADRTARLWDLATRTPLHTLRAHEDKLTSVCFARQGSLVATGGLDGRICVWDVASGKLLHRHTLYDPVQSLTTGADGARIIAGDRGGAISIVDSRAEGLRPVPTTPSPNGPQDLTSVIHLGVVDDAGANEIDERRDRRPPPVELKTWPAHQGRVYSLTRAAGSICMSAGDDGFVKRWATEERSPILEWPAGGAAPLSDIVDVPTAGGLLALDGRDDVRLILRPAGESHAGPLTGDTPQRAVATRDGAVVIGIAPDGRISRWSGLQPAAQDLGALSTGSVPTDLALSPDGSELVAIDFGQNLILWHDARTGAELVRLETRDPRSVAWSADGRRILVAALDHVLLLDGRERKLIDTMARHRGPANCVAFHPDGRLALSGGSDRSVILTDIDERRPAVLRGHQAIVTAAAFCPEGRCFATGDAEGTIKLWHTATRQYLFDLAVDRGAPCTKLLFSADGRRLAALVGGKALVFETQRDVAVDAPALPVVAQTTSN